MSTKRKPIIVAKLSKNNMIINTKTLSSKCSCQLYLVIPTISTSALSAKLNPLSIFLVNTILYHTISYHSISHWTGSPVDDRLVCKDGNFCPVQPPYLPNLTVHYDNFLTNHGVWNKFEMSVTRFIICNLFQLASI